MSNLFARGGFYGGNDSKMNTQMSRKEKMHGDPAQFGWHFN